jgi:uncharacterized protein (UPF0332 family)
MDARDFLTLAEDLSRGSTEAEWRTAVSRAYYAAFHVARELLVQCGFLVPRADPAHSYLWLRLCNCGHLDVQRAGGELNTLRRARNEADYYLRGQLDQATTAVHVQLADQTIQSLEAAALEPIKTQITDAMKVYERDVLRDVTWHP